MVLKRKRVIVANPGSLPEVVVMARQLAEAGVLSEYVTTLVGPTGRVGRLVAFLPRPLRRRVEREAKRRGVVGTIDDSLIRQTAPILEALVMISVRLSLRALQGPLIRLRNFVFGRQVARRLRSHHSAFVGCYGASLPGLRRAHALGVRTYLDYPSAHPAFWEALLTEEASRRPDCAADILRQIPTAAERRHVEAEIEAANEILMLSTFQRQTFIAAGVPVDKLPMIPLGVDLELFKPPRTPPSEIPFRVISVGRISYPKGIPYLVDAFNSARIPGSELLLVGASTDTYRPWRDSSSVRHIDNVPRSDLPRLYAMAHVFVSPSLVEGFGLAALEAMACGLGVIVSENSFGYDVVTNGSEGYVVPIRDHVAIASKLRFLFERPDERARMGRAARARAELFPWHRFAKAAADAILQ
jgi:starch synthase